MATSRLSNLASTGLACQIVEGRNRTRSCMKVVRTSSVSPKKRYRDYIWE